MHTTHEIRSVLTRRGFGEDVIGCVLEDLGQMGYVDDLHFAQTWVTSRSTHQLHGRLRLLRDLRLKGIPDQMAESVIRDSLSDEEEVVIALKAAEKKQRTIRSNGRKGRDALYRHLRSRGFTTRVISLAMAGITFEEDPS